ncbi:MAG: hypothetical protein MJE77_46885 [Proteobacteria bacterium]|nr:hypothetical protein [Pseudomonadota bacterium]
MDKDRNVFEFEEGLSSRIREDYGYEALDDKYKPKDNYLDTVGEIKLARGVDDRFWTLFGGTLTVYGDCKINLAALDDIKLIASLIAYAAKNQNDPVVGNQAKLWALAKAVKEAKELGFAFTTEKAFADLVKDPMGGMGGFLDGLSERGISTPDGSQHTGPPIEGVELDQAKLKQVAKSGARITYRVESTAIIDLPAFETSLEKRIVGVWDTRRPKQNSRAHGTQQKDSSKGFWVYWRED